MKTKSKAEPRKKASQLRNGNVQGQGPTTKKAARKRKPLAPGVYTGRVKHVVRKGDTVVMDMETTASGGDRGPIRFKPEMVNWGTLRAITAEPKPPRTFKEAQEVIKQKDASIERLRQDIRNMSEAHEKAIKESDFLRAKSESTIHQKNAIQFACILENFSRAKTL